MKIFLVTAAILVAALYVSAANAQNRHPLDEKKIGDWTGQCQETKTIARFRCFIVQKRVAEVAKQDKSGSARRQELLLIAAVYATPDGKLGIVLTVPLGVYLPAGLLLKIPGAEPERVVITNCLTNGCRGAKTLEPAFLEVMLKAKTGQVEVVNARRRKVNIPISFNGFAKAFEALPKPPAQ